MTAAAIARRLTRFWTPHGAMIGLAIDHRDSMVAALERRGVPAPPSALIAAIKADVCRTVAPLASTVMIDIQYGSRAIEEGRIPSGGALVMPLEEQGHEATSFSTTLMREHDARAVATRHGGDGCKLLLPLRTDLPSSQRQMHVAARALAVAHEQGLPLVIEAVVPRLPDEPEDAYWSGYARSVLDAARSLAELRPDVLKLPFPGRSASDAESVEACHALTAACGPIPWVLLGGGVDAGEFEAQLRIAMRSGARGFLVGRSVWSGALLADADARAEAIEREVRPAFVRAAAIAGELRPVR